MKKTITFIYNIVLLILKLMKTWKNNINFII